MSTEYDPPPRGNIGRSVGIGDGISAFSGGIGYVLGTPAVWPYAAVPISILMILFCGLTGVGTWGAWELSGNLLGIAPDEKGSFGHWSLTVLMALGVILLASLIGIILAQPLSGFALEKICVYQEESLTGYRRPELTLVRSMILGVRVATVTLLIGGVLFGLLFVVGLVFPPAVVVTVPLKYIFGAMLLSWDFIDYPLGLRGQGLSERLAWVRRNFGAFLAFGLLWAIVLVIPCVGLFLLPMGVAGATRLVVASEEPL